MNWIIATIIIVLITASYLLSSMPESSQGNFGATASAAIASGDIFATLCVLLTGLLIVEIVYFMVLEIWGRTAAFIAGIVMLALYTMYFII